MSTTQASLYASAKETLDKSLPLLDGLHSSSPDADPEEVAALKATVKNQLADVVSELGSVGGPRSARVNQYFGQLLTNGDTGAFPPAVLIADPAKIGGKLGKLRDLLGFNFSNQKTVNSIADEQNLSNFRILSDHVTSLAQSWINNLPLFGSNLAESRVVLLSRQLSVVAESVNDVRFALDSVFVGQAGRQTTSAPLPEDLSLESLSLEDLLSWISDFVTNEGPRLLQDAGIVAIAIIVPVLRRFLNAISHLPKSFSASSPLPQAFFAPRVTMALARLEDELKSMLTMAESVNP
jgi:hypothetical protein